MLGWEGNVGSGVVGNAQSFLFFCWVEKPFFLGGE